MTWVRFRSWFSCAVFIYLVTPILCTGTSADDPAQVPSDDHSVAIAEEGASEPLGKPIEIDGRPILYVYTSTAGISPEERAASIEHKILDAAHNRSLPVELIRAEDRGVWTDILAGNETVMGITEGEAKAVGQPRGQLGAEYSEIIRRTVTRYREEHTWRRLIRGLIETGIATAILLSAIFLLVRIRRVVQTTTRNWIRRTEKEFATRVVLLRFARFLTLPFFGLATLLFFAVVLAFLKFYIVFVLGSFASTRYTSIQINGWIVSELSELFQHFWNYLPNLAIAIVIGVAAHYLIRINKYVFREIQEGTLEVHGFYSDWAVPTAKLVRLLILAATAVVIFPYLPGSSSPAFRGISVFLGVLLSLGSTSAVAHGVAGTILTYMRSFNVGDFVKIGDTLGEVVEKTLLVTRIRTQKNEIVTIPNSSVLGGIVVNYTAEARKQGVIFYTRVSIGYRVPWTTVHELLISAALATTDVLKSPAPFVLQSSLDDFYISYELNAFTRRPQNMQYIYSELHQNIQNKFNERGVEIMSPHYAALRDGNRTSIPDGYVPSDHREPAFAFREVSRSEQPAK